jgi:hypothetical protein
MRCAHDDDLLYGANHILRLVTIHSLPDNVLLDIDCTLDSEWDWASGIANRLAHVCQKWRYVPTWCCDSTPVRKKLEVWPPLLTYRNRVVLQYNYLDDNATPNFALQYNDIIGVLCHGDAVEIMIEGDHKVILAYQRVNNRRQLSPRRVC